jgi:branched-chain amino acid transport system permease protein
LALVLVFAVTRVIYIPQGEFVAYGALSMAAVNAGFLPPTMWLVVTLGIAVAIVDSVAAIREGAKVRLPLIMVWNALLPILAVIAGVLPAASGPGLSAAGGARPGHRRAAGHHDLSPGLPAAWPRPRCWCC